MNLILYLSEAVIPILVLLIVGNGLMHRQHVYEDFLEGAKSGIRTAVEIMPTLIGLMAAVGILRASGFLDFISGWLGKLMAATGFPTELIPVAVVKMFSSSAATGLLLDFVPNWQRPSDGASLPGCCAVFSWSALHPYIW